VAFFIFGNMENSLPRHCIKSWPEADRPREKMLRQGKHVLTDTELLAILISSGTRRKSAMDISRALLESCGGDLNHLARKSVHDLMKEKGIGEAKAVKLAAAIELGGRRQKTENHPKKRIASSRDVFNSLRFRLGDLNHEELWMVSLSRSNEILQERMVSEGGMSATVADPKKIFRYALEDRAAAIIVCHNHPSGNLTPSFADKALTEKLRAAGTFMEIPLLDHLIIAPGDFFSFADEGLL
jgi:DNA repair protein RadC